MKYRSGFTIVELLIVIVIIAILATIGIVAYNGIQRNAQASAISQQLKSISKSFTLWQTEAGFTRWPNDDMPGGGTNISDLIASTTPPFDSLKNYLQKNPSVSGIGTEAWFYDQDETDADYVYCTSNPSASRCNADNKTECSSAEHLKLTGVNVMIRYLSPSQLQLARKVNDTFDNNESESQWDSCGTVRLYQHDADRYILIYSISYVKHISP